MTRRTRCATGRSRRGRCRAEARGRMQGEKKNNTVSAFLVEESKRANQNRSREFPLEGHQEKEGGFLQGTWRKTYRIFFHPNHLQLSRICLRVASVGSWRGLAELKTWANIHMQILQYQPAQRTSQNQKPHEVHSTCF